MRVCKEDYTWRETVKWKNPTPSARRYSRSSSSVEGVDVTLHGKNIVRTSLFTHTHTHTHTRTHARTHTHTPIHTRKPVYTHTNGFWYFAVFDTVLFVVLDDDNEDEGQVSCL